MSATADMPCCCLQIRILHRLQIRPILIVLVPRQHRQREMVETTAAMRIQHLTLLQLHHQKMAREAPETTVIMEARSRRPRLQTMEVRLLHLQALLKSPPQRAQAQHRRPGLPQMRAATGRRPLIAKGTAGIHPQQARLQTMMEEMDPRLPQSPLTMIPHRVVMVETKRGFNPLDEHLFTSADTNAQYRRQQ